MKKRLVLFVEGHGEITAVPILVKKLLSEGGFLKSNPGLLDSHPFRVGGLGKFSGKHSQKWTNYLLTACKRGTTGAVLAVFDADDEQWEGNKFCVRQVAQELVKRGKQIGAGEVFSLAVVFARREFESWLLASAPSLAGKRLASGLETATEVIRFDGDLEEHPRNAKGKLDKLVRNYKPMQHQAGLTEHIDLELVRGRKLTSFTKLENAVRQLASACETGEHLAIPPSMPKP